MTLCARRHKSVACQLACTGPGWKRCSGSSAGFGRHSARPGQRLGSCCAAPLSGPPLLSCRSRVTDSILRGAPAALASAPLLAEMRVRRALARHCRAPMEIARALRAPQARAKEGCRARAPGSRRSARLRLRTPAKRPGRPDGQRASMASGLDGRPSLPTSCGRMDGALLPCAESSPHCLSGALQQRVGRPERGTQRHNVCFECCVHGSDAWRVFLSGRNISSLPWHSGGRCCGAPPNQLPDACVALSKESQQTTPWFPAATAKRAASTAAL